MKKILLVDSFKEKGDKALEAQLRKSQVFREEMTDVEVSFGLLSMMAFRIIDNHLEVYDLYNNCYVSDYDGVLFNYWTLKPMQAMALCVYLDRNKIPYESKEARSIPALDKLGEHVLMADSEVPLVDSLIVQASFLPRAKKLFGTFLKYPFVLKASVAGRGKKNHLVHSDSELKQLCKKYGRDIVLAQSYIPNDSDFRIIIFQGEPRFVMKRFRGSDSGTHLNNVSKGAQAERVADDFLDEHAQKIVKKAAELTGRSNYSGVDLVYDTTNGKPYIFEVNKNPDITSGASSALINEKKSIYSELIRSLL